MTIEQTATTEDDNLVLRVELVPEPCWYANMRKVMPKKAWDALRTQVYADYGNKCAICGARRGPGSWLHCHEQWTYDDARHIQILRGFIALCEWCHHVKHIGLASILASQGKLDYEQVVRHFCAVNACDRDVFDRHVAQAFNQWASRSRFIWTTDLGEYAELVDMDVQL